MTAHILLVNDMDRIIGFADKIEVHTKGLLHRAFSLFVFNSKNEMLLQRRAKVKYHSGGLWTNTCCSHALSGLPLEDVVHRRLFREMGFDCPVQEKFVLRYRAELKNGLIENEIDHIFIGEFDGDPSPAADEADAWKWVSMDEVQRLIAESPDDFTEWFKIIIPELIKQRIGISA
jgi:isopentenyl-diphosphate delta-isomerase